ncbi:MAG: hypothetical protein ACNA7Y_03285 [Gammaproteobacteria bacterium]
MQEHNDSRFIERAGRVRKLRNALRLSRGYFAKYDIPSQTLQGWEDPRWGNLTEKGAKKLAHAFEQEGLHVTVDWLMYGAGLDPLATRIAESGAIYHIPLTQQAIIAQELRIFQQNNSDMMDTIIQDEAMLPCLAPGDHVAGKRFFDQDMQQALGFSCIVQTQTGMMLVRKVEQGSAPDVYTLVGTNPETPIETNVALFSVAPIMWIRKPDITRKK